MARGRGRACSSSSILPSRPTAAHVRMTADFSLAPVIMSRMLRTFSALMSSPLAVSSLSSLLLISRTCPATQRSSCCDAGLRHVPRTGNGQSLPPTRRWKWYRWVETWPLKSRSLQSNAEVVQQSPVRPRLDHQLHYRLPMWAGGVGVELVRLEDGPLRWELHHSAKKICQTLLCVWHVWLPGYNCPPRTEKFADFFTNSIRTFLTYILPDFFHTITSILLGEKE